MADAERAMAHDPIMERSLFAHWRVDTSQMRRVVPDIFDLDLFHGEAWLGVVPFYMTNVGVRAAPAFPWLSAFPELNVRTYVRVSDRPGVYFFSLDAGRRLAVAAARALLNLPYYAAVMSVERRDAAVHYRSARRIGTCDFNAVYEPVGAPFAASVGSISIPHGALLPVSPRSSKPPLPTGDSPPAVVPAGRTGDDHDQHDGRS